jgi:hypothetical protein
MPKFKNPPSKIYHSSFPNITWQTALFLVSLLFTVFDIAVNSSIALNDMAVEKWIEKDVNKEYWWFVQEELDI